MNPVETFMVAIALGCDAFAVGLGVGTRFCAPRQVFRLSFHFGLFQFMMPLLGWFLGLKIVGIASRWGPLVAFGLLFFIGGKMIYESLRPGESQDDTSCLDPTKGFSLVVLSTATSIDALGVGLSLGMLQQSLLNAAIFIGITACLMTLVAMLLGNRLSSNFGRRVEALGGMVLMAIGIKLLF